LSASNSAEFWKGFAPKVAKHLVAMALWATLVQLRLVRLALFAVVSARADDWPQWRGPNRDGVWRETGILETIPALTGNDRATLRRHRSGIPAVAFFPGRSSTGQRSGMDDAVRLWTLTRHK